MTSNVESKKNSVKIGLRYDRANIHILTAFDETLVCDVREASAVRLIPTVDAVRYSVAHTRRENALWASLAAAVAYYGREKECKVSNDTLQKRSPPFLQCSSRHNWSASSVQFSQFRTPLHMCDTLTVQFSSNTTGSSGTVTALLQAPLRRRSLDR